MFIHFLYQEEAFQVVESTLVIDDISISLAPAFEPIALEASFGNFIACISSCPGATACI